eukprot:6383862-Pyramimonas_sp.AAC.1
MALKEKRDQGGGRRDGRHPQDRTAHSESLDPADFARAAMMAGRALTDRSCSRWLPPCALGRGQPADATSPVAQGGRGG